MTNEYELSTCISGSFKFKPEIDLLIEEFQDLHVKVRAPEKGWIALPRYRIALPKFRPLPSEQKMSIRLIEDNFLNKIRKSTFLYVASYEGYTGFSTDFEMGFALGADKPIYSVERIKNLENDLTTEEIINTVKIMTPAETVQDMRKLIENSSGL